MNVRANSAIFFFGAILSAAAAANPIDIVSTYHFRDVRGPNSVNFGVGDRLVFGAHVDDKDGTSVTAQQGSVSLGLGRVLDDVTSPFEYSRSIPYNPSLTGSWSMTAVNGTDTAFSTSNAVGNVGLLPFVRNFRIAPNGLTPTLLWDLPVGNTEPFTSVRIGLFDDRNNFRLGFNPTNPSVFNFVTLPSGATSYTFLPGVLEENVPYVMRVILSNSLPGIGEVNRATSFKNFTPIAGTGGPPVQLPTIDSSGVFNFDFDVLAGQPIVLDPFVATGYDYQTGAGDPNFASVIFPEVGDNLFNLTFIDDSGASVNEVVAAGSEYLFPSLGVDAFTVTGIELTAGLDPTDVTAFMTTVTYVSDGTFTGTMTPITQFVADAVPEPTTIVLLFLGMLGAGSASRRRTH